MKHREWTAIVDPLVVAHRRVTVFERDDELPPALVPVRDAIAAAIDAAYKVKP